MNRHVETSVLERYSAGAKQREEALCCPVSYDAGLLALLPDEIIERDYGCGDPSRHVQPGDVVLDLGSGGGKICYMAAQLTGNDGHVIGIDMNDDMLALARRYQPLMAERLGGDRVTFLKGHIQDLALDVEALQAYLAQHPVASHADYLTLQEWQRTQRAMHPLVADASIDLVISNCVLNLVAEQDRMQMLGEIYRVLRPGGRLAIADIVCDRPVPESLKQDAELWSGCVSGAFTEQGMLDAFAAAGFVGTGFDKRDARPWRVVQGIEFRSVTLTALRPAGGSGAARAMMYRGPFASVTDDRGNSYRRGERQLVPAAIAAELGHHHYAGAFIDLSDDGQTGGCEGDSCCG